MIQIQPQAKYISLMHNVCPKSEGQYRLLKFCIKQNLENGAFLLFNNMTKEMLLLNMGELQNHDIDAYLKRRLFLVPESNDDHALSLRIREFIRQIQPKRPRICYKIFTTTKCNARCFYCFERKWEQRDMDESVARKIVAYITKQYEKILQIKDGTKQKIRLEWFGGEPLCNTSPIHIICSELNDMGIPFTSQMTTNGYLLDEKTLRFAKEWRLNSVQITLDGTEHTYNKTKNYIRTDEGVSPYKVVIENIRTALDEGIEVIIRVNLGLNNYDELLNLVKELTGLYAHYKRFCIYCALLMESCSVYDMKLTDSEKEQLASQKRVITEYLVKNDVSIEKERRLSNTIQTYYCMADSNDGIVILPTGELTLCEHYNKEQIIGHIDSPETLNTKIIDSFKEEYERTALCNDCPLFPNCIRLKKCEYKGECSELKKQMNIDGTKEKMLKTYEAYKCKHEEELA